MTKDPLWLSIAKALKSIQQKEISILKNERVHGGDINQSYHLTTNSGEFFVKINNSQFHGMFAKEYHGLEILSDTHTIKVPKPVYTGEHDHQQFLVMEWLEEGKPSSQFWIEFATGLASLHRNYGEKFGLKENNFIGSLPQNNDEHERWSEFYSTQRILPLMKRAVREKKADDTDMRLAEKLSTRLDIIFPPEPAALLHGDLWSGNFMSTKTGQAAIFDPAVYYGHREMDLGMSLLFGGFDKTFYDHYNEFYPLEKGWKNRIGLCQLYPLLVHLILFGTAYYPRVKNILMNYS